MVLGELTAAFHCLQGGYQGDGGRLFTVGHAGRARDNVHKQKQEVLTGCKQRLFNHEDSQAVSTLGGFHDQTRQPDLISWLTLQEVGLDWLLRFPPT